MDYSNLADRHEAYGLLKELGGTERLLVHVRLVGEAADILVQAYAKLGLSFDGRLIELGAALHDAGKVQHPQELNEPGSQHEHAGEALLLARGVKAEIARCCVTHSAWGGPDVSLEERTIALADKLWKGRREEGLELYVIDEVASRLALDRWDVFGVLDSVFEEIAAGGAERLGRSRPV